MPATIAKVVCHVCDGSGDCKNHDERYIKEDVTELCQNCGSINGNCPICKGEGKITEDYATYLISVGDPRD